MSIRGGISLARPGYTVARHRTALATIRELRQCLSSPFTGEVLA